MITTTISEGSIHCGLHNMDVTGEDCSCLQDKTCAGCFIYDSFHDSEEDVTLN